MLTEEQLVNFKEKLFKEKTRIETELSGFADKKSDGDYKTRYVDIGDEVEDNIEEYRQHDVNLSLEKNLEAGLKDVNDALMRMDKGIYGICEGTGEPIKLERLEAYPAARYSIEYENKQ